MNTCVFASFCFHSTGDVISSFRKSHPDVSDMLHVSARSAHGPQSAPIPRQAHAELTAEVAAFKPHITDETLGFLHDAEWNKQIRDVYLRAFTTKFEATFRGGWVLRNPSSGPSGAVVANPQE